MSDVPLFGRVEECLARVEAAIEGLRHSQNLTIGATLGVGAILAAFIIASGIDGLQRIDAIDARLNTVDAKLNTIETTIDRKIDQKFDAFATRFSEEAARNRQELISVATAIGNAITAARQPAVPPVPPGTTGGGGPVPAPR